MRYWEGEFTYKGDPFYAKVEYEIDPYCVIVKTFDIIDLDDISVFDPTKEMLDEIEYKILTSLEKEIERDYE